ncbi:highly divergent homeobox [Trichomycterus rosablanca]|uniref:highly divergent homeobox n=1 Tax=Trichomycterus rosablanca TaxID=2290929 RepID=UPI002F357463
MEAWQEKRSVHTMNLRSVFTAEQQRILERYYKNGMTNQSKGCFQLILQCAQEVKLDFSVVRTWVGNKRRKLASKAEKNGVVGLSNHAIVSASGALVVSPVLTSELAAVRNVQHGPAVAHLLPPPSSCPSSTSSSSTSSSPSSNGLKNNNDVIVTGAYSLQRIANRPDASSQSRVAAKVVPLNSNPEQSLHSRLVLHPDVASLQRKSPQVPMLNQMRKTISLRDLASVPPSWAKQYGAPQHQPWPQVSHQQTSANLHRTPPASPADSGVRIQQVFTIAGLTDSSPRPSPGTSQDHGVRKINMPSSSDTFSIAMETGDADDEYSREEELANMSAQLHLSKSTGSTSAVEGNRSSTGEPHQISNQGVYAVTARSQFHVGQNSPHSPNSALFGEKGCQTNSPLLLSTTSHGSFPVSETSPSRVPDLKESMMSAPWLLSNSRKRTLQDRTQFSNGDLYTLKRYWDNGMTSLGSVCREKISAASTELNVDAEIIKTWIGNRRRKYRLMGIEIPPPKGGPVTFPKVAGTELPPSSTPEGDGVRYTAPQQDGEQSDAVSLCLSEDGASDSYLKENDDVNDGSNSSVLNENMKIEIIDEDDDDDVDDEGDVMATDMEQMQSFLEYKHEEVQYLESELESQKRKYHELMTFTKHLLTALKSNDTEKQQELLSSLPHHIEDDIAASQERDVEMNCNQKDSSVSEGDGGTEPV